MKEIIYLFFFQAEDGIRDLYVTGVQTCALPISVPGGSWHSRSRGYQCPAHECQDPPGTVDESSVYARGWRKRDECRAGLRSEERRVGKEGKDGATPS